VSQGRQDGLVYMSKKGYIIEVIRGSREEAPGRQLRLYFLSAFWQIETVTIDTAISCKVTM
jgi:hypothetical protein